MLILSLIVLILLLISVLLFVAFKKEEKLSHINNSGMRTELKPKSSYPVGTINYHEDDFCQVQLIPSENMQDVKEETESILEFNEKNFDGHGSRGIRVRKKHKIQLNSRKISREELDEIFVKTQTDRHSQVVTGYGQHEESSRNTIGYGSGHSAIYFDFNIDGVVQNVWMTDIRFFKGNDIASVLYEIGIRWNLILMDWNSLEFVDLKNMTEIENYLRLDQSEIV
jgi:hypothetical protein